MDKQDYAISGLIGFFAGIFAIPVLMNLGHRDPFVLLALPWVLAIASAIGAIIAGYLGKKMPFFNQFAKFIVVGVLNTTIDFGILNTISLITGVTGGVVVGGVNLPGVALALVNAYFWNKYWVFKHRDDKGALGDLPRFLLVSAIGITINSGVVILATSYPVMSLDAKTWLNIAKAIASVSSLAWNFLGYKFIVFRTAAPKEPEHTPIAPL